jgi:hypothetical protein
MTQHAPALIGAFWTLLRLQSDVGWKCVAHQLVFFGCLDYPTFSPSPVVSIDVSREKFMRPIVVLKHSYSGVIHCNHSERRLDGCLSYFFRERIHPLSLSALPRFIVRLLRLIDWRRLHRPVAQDRARIVFEDERATLLDLQRWQPERAIYVPASSKHVARRYN